MPNIPPTIQDLTGSEFGLVSVVRFLDMIELSTGFRHASWLCECICTKTFTAFSNELLNRKINTCGCPGIRKEDLVPAWLQKKVKRGTLQWAKRILSSQRSAAKRGGFVPPTISAEELVKFYSIHPHLCDVCSAPEESFANGLSLDHDHLTGAVRGYLCPGCNTLLGKLRDRMDIFENLKRYLNKELLTQEVTI